VIAHAKTVMGVDNTAAAGGPDVYYYGVGSDAYSNQQYWDVNTISGDIITCADAGSITTIGVKGKQTGNTDKVSLYWLDGSTWTRVECKTGVATINGWTDATLETPYAVTAGQTVLVCYTTNAGNTGLHATDDAALGMYKYTSNVNASFDGLGYATIAYTADVAGAVRVYVD